MIVTLSNYFVHLQVRRNFILACVRGKERTSFAGAGEGARTVGMLKDTIYLSGEILVVRAT
jgi:hypothetical protein